MTKPPGETEALEPQVDLRDLAKSALTKIPGLGDVLEVVEEAHRRSRDRRKHQWAAYVAYGSDDGAEFAAKLRAAFESTEGELVRSVVLEGARAAVDAVDDAVIPSIGLLTRRRLQTGTPDLCRYRELLEMLRTLDAEEFLALRAVLQSITTMLATKPHLGPYDVRTQLYFDRVHPKDDGRWRFVAWIPFEANYLSTDRTVDLLDGPMAFRLVAMLQGSDRLIFERAERTKDGPIFTRQMIDVLSSIIPSP